MPPPIRSRSNKSIGDTIEVKWTITAKRVIAEPTPRINHEPPKLGIYEYEVVPLGAAAPVSSTTDAREKQPLVSFRRVN